MNAPVTRSGGRVRRRLQYWELAERRGMRAWTLESVFGTLCPI